MWKEGDRAEGPCWARPKTLMKVIAHLPRARFMRFRLFSEDSLAPASVITRVCGASQSPLLHL